MRRLSGVRSIVMVMAFPLLLVAAGCDESTTAPDLENIDLQPGHVLLDGEVDVAFRAEAAAFESGGPVTLVLEHRGGEPVGFNLCFHGLERRSGDGWNALEESRICTTHLNVLEAGQTAEYETELPPTLGDGEYRFRVALYLMDREEKRDLASDPFQIDG